jgi:hypothetical protein
MLVFSVISTGMSLPPVLLRMLVQRGKEVSNYELTLHTPHMYVQYIYIRFVNSFPIAERQGKAAYPQTRVALRLLERCLLLRTSENSVKAKFG